MSIYIETDSEDRHIRNRKRFIKKKYNEYHQVVHEINHT